MVSQHSSLGFPSFSLIAEFIDLHYQYYALMAVDLQRWLACLPTHDFFIVVPRMTFSTETKRCLILNPHGLLMLGATDHMTCEATQFISSKPCARHQMVTVTNGSTIQVSGHESSLYTLKLENVLHT